MNYNYTLKYRTFDQLLADVMVDFRNYNLEGRIDSAQLIKIALKTNYDLGLRINKTHEQVLDLSHKRAKLPDNFYVMNFAFVCGEYSVCSVLPQGTNIQEVPYPRYTEVPPTDNICVDPNVNCSKCNSLPCGCVNASCLSPNINPGTCEFPAPVYDSSLPYGDPCIKPRVYLDCKGNAMELIQVVNTEQRTYKAFYPIKFRNSQLVDCNCPNLRMMCKDEAYIQDGFIWTNLDTCTIYINYQGALEDDEGNILVPDHPMLNEYYEYALKKRMLENLFAEGVNVGPQLQMVQAELRAARNNALSIVNTPNFSEMQKVWSMNRKAMYARYYDMFSSYFHPHDLRTNNAV